MSDATVIETTDATSAATDQDVLGEAGKKALDAERDARKAAEKTARDTARELEALKTAAAKAKDDEAVEQGQWKELAEKREVDLTTATTSLKTLKAENETLSAYFTTQFDAALKDLPDVVKAFAPATDASFETKSKWLTTAQTEARKLEKAKPRGAGFDPPPGGKALDERQEVQRIRSRIAPL